jgi:hypothetical protein
LNSDAPYGLKETAIEELRKELKDTIETLRDTPNTNLNGEKSASSNTAKFQPILNRVSRIIIIGRARRKS